MSDCRIDAKTGRVTMTWSARDALEVAYVLQRAGTDQSSGAIIDRGFYDDGVAMFTAADDWLSDHDRREPSRG